MVYKVAIRNMFLVPYLRKPEIGQIGQIGQTGKKSGIKKGP